MEGAEQGLSHPIERPYAMKKKKIFLFLLLSTFPIFSGHSLGAVMGGETGPLHVVDGALCLNISGLKCIDPNMRFSSDVGKLYCFTRIVGATNPTWITHVWHFGARERFRINLDVQSPNWRTYSAKTIAPTEIGDWNVEILGPQGESLAVYEFTIERVPPGRDTALSATSQRVDDAVKRAEKALSGESAERKPVEVPLGRGSVTQKMERDTGDPDTRLAVKTGPPPPDHEASLPVEEIREQGMAPAPKRAFIGKNIELQVGDEGADRLYVDLNHYAIPIVLVLGGDAPRVAVHIINVSSWDGRSEISVNGTVIKKVRSRLNRNSEILRILLDLDPGLNYDVRSYRESKNLYCVSVSEKR